jgi:hypothetical protein
MVCWADKDKPAGSGSFLRVNSKYVYLAGGELRILSKEMALEVRNAIQIAYAMHELLKVRPDRTDLPNDYELWHSVCQVENEEE